MFFTSDLSLRSHFRLKKGEKEQSGNIFCYSYLFVRQLRATKTPVGGPVICNWHLLCNQLLTEWLENLSCYQLVVKVKLCFQVLKSHTHLPIRVGKVGEEGEVTVEIFRHVKVDGVETRTRSVKHRVSWFNDQEDDQSCNSKENKKKTENETESCTTP